MVRYKKVREFVEKETKDTARARIACKESEGTLNEIQQVFIGVI